MVGLGLEQATRNTNEIHEIRYLFIRNQDKGRRCEIQAGSVLAFHFSYEPYSAGHSFMSKYEDTANASQTLRNEDLIGGSRYMRERVESAVLPLRVDPRDELSAEQLAQLQALEQLPYQRDFKVEEARRTCRR